MEPKRNKTKKSIRLSTAVSIFMSLTLCLLTIITLTNCEKKEDAEATLQGVGELSNLETQDPAEVEEQRRLEEESRHAEEVSKEIEEQEEKIDSGEVDIWSLFDDSVVMGDSRAVGFSYFHFMREDHVLASSGNTIRNIEPHIETLKSISPSTVYICYGLNDTGMGFWKDGDEYGAELVEIFNKLKAALPNTTFVASSILPTTQAAINRSPVWGKTVDFDRGLKEACEKTGVIYADNNELAAECMEEYWEVDGIHLKSTFYPLWAKNLYMAKVKGLSE